MIPAGIIGAASDSVGVFVFIWAVIDGVVLLWLWMANIQPVNDENNRDYRVSKAIETGVPIVCSGPVFPPGSAPGFSRILDLRLGEISRHFDSQLAASLEGWMDHDLGFHGFGVGLGVGGVGVRVGNLGLAGHSDVHLTMTGTARDNLLVDAFMAVLEEDLPRGGLDTVRVVVPSEPAARQFVSGLLDQWAERFGAGSHTEYIVRAGAIKMVQGSFKLDVSYVSDRLGAILRMPPEKRPTISIVGPELAEHIVLGSAIRFQ